MELTLHLLSKCCSIEELDMHISAASAVHLHTSCCPRWKLLHESCVDTESQIKLREHGSIKKLEKLVATAGEVHLHTLQYPRSECPTYQARKGMCNDIWSARITVRTSIKFARCSSEISVINLFSKSSIGSTVWTPKLPKWSHRPKPRSRPTLFRPMLPALVAWALL